MPNQPKTCGTCAMRSDAVNSRTPDFCYEFDKTVMSDAPACSEWQASLRSEPVNGPEMGLVENTTSQDNQIKP